MKNTKYDLIVKKIITDLEIELKTRKIPTDVSNELISLAKNKILSEDKCNEIIVYLREQIKSYVKANQLQSLVVGISGGLDSAIIASLCQKKYTGVDLIGLTIPLSSSFKHVSQAKRVGKKYCTIFEEFESWEDGDLHGNINLGVLDFNNSILKSNKIKVSDEKNRIAYGNLKARLRMITLYDMAFKSNGMVLSTDNFSEYLMGFWTLHGDVGDYGLIQNLYKGLELPIIATLLDIDEDIINQKPSDGLMVTDENTDEAQLGASYVLVDVLSNYFEKQNLNEIEMKIVELDVYKRLLNRYKSTQFKRNGVINIEINRD